MGDAIEVGGPRACIRCSKVQDLSEFPVNRRKVADCVKEYLSGVCKACRTARHREWRQKHLAQRAAAVRHCRERKREQREREKQKAG